MTYSKNAAYEPENINYSNETVIYLGMFYVIWGHLITDNMKRLWFLKSDIYRNYFKNCKLIYVPQDDFDFEKSIYHFHFAKLLDILGINYKEIQPIKEATRYKNIILPDESFYYTPEKGRYFTNEYVEMMDCVRHHLLKCYGSLNHCTLPFKKVYFFHGMRGQIGEDRLAAFFSSKGYAIINPYKFSLEEELTILINCESFASAIGSASHNLIFLRDNAEVILIPRGAYLTDYQEALNQIHNLRITYIDSTMSLFSKGGEGPYYYMISNKLQEYFGDKKEENFKYDEKDLKNFIIYLKKSHSKGLPYNQKSMEYYGDVATEFINQLKQQEPRLKEAGIVIY